MAYHVIVTSKGSSGKPKTYRGENVQVEGNVIKLWTEPHEIVAGGPVDPFVGKVITLAPGDVAEVVRV